MKALFSMMREMQLLHEDGLLSQKLRLKLEWREQSGGIKCFA